MKKIIFSVFLLCSISGFSQMMPDSIANKQVSITLKMKYHAYIIALMPNRASGEAFKYINQIVAAVSGNTVDTSISVTVTVPYRMVAGMYLTIGSHQERLTATDNIAIKTALFTQLSANPVYADLLQVIQSIAIQNAVETEQIRTQGKNFILSIK